MGNEVVMFYDEVVTGRIRSTVKLELPGDFPLNQPINGGRCRRIKSMNKICGRSVGDHLTHIMHEVDYSWHLRIGGFINKALYLLVSQFVT